MKKFSWILSLPGRTLGMTIIIAVMLGFICSSCGKDTVKPIPTPTPTPTPVPKPAGVNIDSLVASDKAVLIYFPTASLPAGATVRADCSNGASQNSLDGSPISFTGLQNGTKYDFTLTVISNNVSSDKSASKSSIPMSNNTKKLISNPAGLQLVDRAYYSGTTLVPYGVDSIGKAKRYVFTSQFKFSVIDGANTFGPFDWSYLDTQETQIKLSGASGPIILLTDHKFIFEYKSTFNIGGTELVVWRDTYIF